MLFAPAPSDVPIPADCGNHHIRRNSSCRLVIIFRPTKSRTKGLTCVATYIAGECTKGRSIGLVSVPYPPEIARRVVHASNAAAPDDANISVYQIFFCRCVPYSPFAAGWTGLTARGAPPGTAGSAAAAALNGAGFELSAISASVLILGSGVEGIAVEREDCFAVSTETLAGRSVTAFSTTALCGEG